MQKIEEGINSKCKQWRKKPTVRLNNGREETHSKVQTKKPTVRFRRVDEVTNRKMKHWRKKPTVRCKPRNPQ